MHLRTVASVAAFLVLLVSVAIAKDREIVKPRDYKPPVMNSSFELNKIVEDAAKEAMTEFKTLKPTDLAVTVIRLGEGGRFDFGEHRGEEAI